MLTRDRHQKTRGHGRRGTWDEILRVYIGAVCFDFEEVQEKLDYGGVLFGLFPSIIPLRGRGI